jgi:hypothetical protein
MYNKPSVFTSAFHSDPTKTKPGQRFYIHARNVASAIYFLVTGVESKTGTASKFNIVGEREVRFANFKTKSLEEIRLEKQSLMAEQDRLKKIQVETAIKISDLDRAEDIYRIAKQNAEDELKKLDDKKAELFLFDKRLNDTKKDLDEQAKSQRENQLSLDNRKIELDDKDKEQQG